MTHFLQRRLCPHCRQRMCPYPVQQRSPQSTASSLRYHRTSGPPDTPRTAGSTTGSAHVSRTPSMCRTGARRGTRDRSCPSARQTCTVPADTPLGASSSRGPMRPLVLPTPTRLACTPSAVRTQRRRSCLTKCPVRPTRTPRRRGWPWRCRRSSGPGLPGTCATRCNPARSRSRRPRMCRWNMPCSRQNLQQPNIRRCTACKSLHPLPNSSLPSTALQ